MSEYRQKVYATGGGEWVQVIPKMNFAASGAVVETHDEKFMCGKGEVIQMRMIRIRGTP